MSLELIGWLFTIGVLIHNTEEALWLPDWSLHSGKWHPPVGPREFRFAVFVLSLVLVIFSLLSSLNPAGSISAHLMAGYVLAMVLNVFFPHVLATVFMRRYMPGTASALLFNLPLGLIYLSRALSEHRIELHVFYWAGPVIVVGILSLIPVLFFVGREWFPVVRR